MNDLQRANCEACGAPLELDANTESVVCSYCGTRFVRPQAASPAPPIIIAPPPVAYPVSYAPPVPVRSDKSPGLALLLSACLMGGAGQVYLGQKNKGIALILGTLFMGGCVGLGFVIWLAGAVDAYSTAKKMREGVAVGPWEFNFDRKATLIALAVAALAIVSIALLTGLNALITRLQ